jgi:hypothetical protein
MSEDQTTKRKFVRKPTVADEATKNEDGTWTVTEGGETRTMQDSIFQATYEQAGQFIEVPLPDGVKKLMVVEKIGIAIGEEHVALVVGEHHVVPMPLPALGRLVQMLMGAGEHLAQKSAPRIVPVSAMPAGMPQHPGNTVFGGPQRPNPGVPFKGIIKP